MVQGKQTRDQIMNELIKELAEQAGDDWEHTLPSDREFLEKFAELIIRECRDIAYEYDEPKLSGPGMIIGNRIEEHFGVE